MRSPITALSWDIWQRNRRLVWLVIGILLFDWLFNLVLPDNVRAADVGHGWLTAMNGLLIFISVLLVFGICGYTELNPQKGSIGFPERLFVLPVTSLMLVALPTALGVGAVELVLAWVRLAIAHGEGAIWELGAVLLGAYMVFCQTILWNLSGLRSLRVVVLGLIAVSLMVLSFLPSFPQAPLSARAVIASVSGLALMAFLISWIGIARQRSGGGRKRNWAAVAVPIQWIVDAVPRRTRPFDSPEGAQFWFEWRRSGSRLPLYTGALLLLVIGPLSWSMRNEDGGALRILIVAVAMPMILALPVGKAFSKPDFWSADLSLPAFIAVRPLATDEIVVIKMKAAAASAAISWLLVLAFFSLWLPFWANTKSLTVVERSIEQIYGGSVYPLYAIAALAILAGVLVTWSFLVGGLWIGLSGNRKLFFASALPYGLAPLGLIVVLLVVRPDSPLRVWIRNDPDRLLFLVERMALLALIAKFSLAALFWRRIAAQRVRQYLPIWFGATLCLMALAILLWSGLRHVFPFDVYRLRNVMILAAALLIPFAQLGLAPSFLAKNRHR